LNKNDCLKQWNQNRQLRNKLFIEKEKPNAIFQVNQGRRESRVPRVSLAPPDKTARRENEERKDWGYLDQR
jgi:hypothetical protein